MISFDYARDPLDEDPGRSKEIGGWTYEVFMMNLDAIITISTDSNYWKFSVPVMNFVNSLMAAATKLSDSRKSVEFKHC